VYEGNLLGYIIAKSRIKFDWERVQTITQIPHLVNKKAMQSLGKINFLRKFISDYAKIVKPIQEMIKKDAIYNWGKNENDVFTHIKQEIVDALVLYNQDFNKDFFLYTFASNNSLAAVLT